MEPIGLFRKLFGEESLKEQKLELKYIPVNQIHQNPYQPRKHFDLKQMEELKQSIDTYGVIVPIVVRKIERGHEIVCGERRLRACKELGIESIPAIIRVLSADEMLELAFIENAQRANLNSVEEAESYTRIQKEFTKLSDEELSKKLGKPKEYIQAIKKVLSYPQVVRKSLMMEIITSGHAEHLSRLPDEESILIVLKKINEHNLDSEETAVLVNKIINSKESIKT